MANIQPAQKMSNSAAGAAATTNPQEIRYSRGTGKLDNTPEQLTAKDFDAFERHVLSLVSGSKGMTYICAPLTCGPHDHPDKHPDDNHWRLKNRADKRRFLPLDLDGFARPEVYNGLLGYLRAYRGFSYTSSSYTKEAPRARVILELTRAVDRSEGLLLARRFQAILERDIVNGGIKFDPSVYRAEMPVYTPVSNREKSFEKFILDGEPLDVDAMLAEAAEDGEYPNPRDNPGGGTLTSAYLDTPVPEHLLDIKEGNIPQKAAREFLPSDADKVADQCEQIARFRDPSRNPDGKLPEPAWRECIGVVAYCEGGKDKCHEWSKLDERYCQFETEEKVVYRLNGGGPTLCETFKQINPEGCEGCTQTCKSPITLGTVLPEAREYLRYRFGLINLDGAPRLFDKLELGELDAHGRAAKFTPSRRLDGILFLQRAIHEIYPQADAKALAAGFWTDPTVPMLTGVTFDPRPSPNSRMLNLWVGPTIRPAPGKWDVLRAFLMDVICAGDTTCYDFLINYLAHALQKPEEKPGAIVAMLGGQGIGKGTLGKILRKIWSATYLQVHNMDHVTGTFNGALERTYIVFLDEALFVGDRKGTDALKGLVTESELNINEKHQPSRRITSYHRFFAATNAEHFKHTDPDDRRDFVLQVSEAHKGDAPYWKRVHAAIDGGEVEAMVHDLLMMDLSGFDVRNPPKTGALAEQKIRSLKGIPHWWHDCLYRGDIHAGDKWPGFVSTDEVTEGSWEASGRKDHRKPGTNEAVDIIRKMCPSAKKHRVRQGHLQLRGLTLPDLRQARQEFEKYIGSPVRWK